MKRKGESGGWERKSRKAGLATARGVKGPEGARPEAGLTGNGHVKSSAQRVGRPGAQPDASQMFVE